MVDQLRIQCPSCGIILDVRNSKHEAHKQIVCPNCKKQLAVNFEEELETSAPSQPIEPLYYGEMRIDLQEGLNKISLPDLDKAEIKVVRLRDGSSKCMVRPLSNYSSVIVNGQQLQIEEQVVLSKGDYVEVGRTCLRAGEAGSLTPSTQLKTDDKRVEETSQSRPQKEGNYIWLYAAVAFVVLMGATILLWPSESVPEEPQKVPQPVQVSDTMVNNPPKSESDKPKESPKPVVKPTVASPQPPTAITEELSDYDLERMATKGDIEAQYKLGVKLIKGGGVSNVIRGINYLKAAANKGSSKARTALNKAINSLQNRANQGDSISYYILKSI